MSKGDRPRPIEDKEAWYKNYQRIFGDTKAKEIADHFAEDHFEYTPNPKPVVEGEESKET